MPSTTRWPSKYGICFRSKAAVVYIPQPEGLGQIKHVN